LVPERHGTALDVPQSYRPSKTEVAYDWFDDYIRVERVKETDTRFGTVPVNGKAANESRVLLVGVDVGTNGSKLTELEQLGQTIVAEAGVETLLAVIDHVMADIVQRIVTIVDDEDLIFSNTSLGLTGRSIITGQKPRLIVENLRLKTGEPWTSSHDILFVEDGLAMGAAVAARCMNSMGTKKNPMGGRKGDRCIMAKRMKLQKKRHG
jgi:hypothetical protein